MSFVNAKGEPLPPGHHLARHSGGSYRAMVTISPIDPRFAGERLFVPLRTRDLEEAAVRRDIAFDALSWLGVLTSSINSVRGRFWDGVRCIVEVSPIDPRFAGEKLSLPLRTWSTDEAWPRAEIIRDALRRLGVIISSVSLRAGNNLCG